MVPQMDRQIGIHLTIEEGHGDGQRCQEKKGKVFPPAPSPPPPSAASLLRPFCRFRLGDQPQHGRTEQEQRSGRQTEHQGRVRPEQEQAQHRPRRGPHVEGHVQQGIHLRPPVIRDQIGDLRVGRRVEEGLADSAQRGQPGKGVNGIRPHKSGHTDALDGEGRRHHRLSSRPVRPLPGKQSGDHRRKGLKGDHQRGQKKVTVQLGKEIKHQKGANHETGDLRQRRPKHPNPDGSVVPV